MPIQHLNTITDVPGIRLGHAQDDEALTGCTVVLCEDGAVGGVDQRGGAPGTRETDLLRPMHRVDRLHAVVLAGGSAFGLAAAGCTDAASQCPSSAPCARTPRTARSSCCT